MRMYAVAKLEGGYPDIPRTEVNPYPYVGHVLVKEKGGWGLYLFSGTKAQLLAIGGLPNVLPLVGMTENGEIKYPELDDTIIPAVRNKLNNWLSSKGYPNVPAGWKYRQVLRELRDRFDLTQEELDVTWVKDET